MGLIFVFLESNRHLLLFGGRYLLATVDGSDVLVVLYVRVFFWPFCFPFRRSVGASCLHKVLDSNDDDDDHHHQ